MNRRSCWVVYVLSLSLLNSAFVWAETIEMEQERIHSMGLPSRAEFFWGPLLSLDLQGTDRHLGGQLSTGMSYALFNPIWGLGVTGEGYLGTTHGKTAAGARAMAEAKLLFLQAGVDYSFREQEADVLLSLRFPLWRGGLFGMGGHLRLDWLPGRNQTLNLGFSRPLGNPFSGRTRAKKDQVSLPEHSPLVFQAAQARMEPELEQTLERLGQTAEWISRYTTPFFDQEDLEQPAPAPKFLAKLRGFRDDLHQTDDFFSTRHTFDDELAVYHHLLERAFLLAVHGDVQGRQLAAKARDLLFQRVLLPYDRLIGRNKDRDSLLGYAMDASAEFTAWLESRSGFSQPRQITASLVFQRILAQIEQVRRNTQKIWGDSALVWLPLQYGLLPEQYETQQGLNSILEQLTGGQFSHANSVSYVINEEFQDELSRMIHRAEDYHVLWIHDYRGVNAEGDPDRIAFRQTVEAYLAALTEKVRQYDATGKIPVYLILLDQYFFEVNQGRFWLELLQNPLEHEMRFSEDYRFWAAAITAAQDELRAAVAESKLLQAQIQEHGTAWLRSVIKVHVNITNPSDYSFRSAYLIRRLPFVPDNLMRDHRKVAFADVSEEDPGKGEAMYGGMGIGEHYTGPAWEDRALLVRGPALLPLKEAARQVLLQQGFAEADIPPPLRLRALSPEYLDQVELLRQQGWTASVMDVHNQTGFWPKSITALKAALYNLMPKGSTLIVPDSLWNASFWGGMLTGAALRGSRVMVIAPALDNAPSAGFPQMSRAQELFSKLITIQQELGEELDAVGGMLKVGIYTRASDVNDTRQMLEEFLQGFRTSPFLKEVFPFSDDVYAVVDDFDRELSLAGVPVWLSRGTPKKPKLHLKLNFFASGLIDDVFQKPGWEQLFREYLRYREQYTRVPGDSSEIKNIPQELRELFNRTLQQHWNTFSEDEQQRMIAFLTLGSHNQDYRGALMDGEAVSVVAGRESLVALLDLFFLAGVTTWVDDLETLEDLLPAYSGWKRWLGRYIMKAL